MSHHLRVRLWLVSRKAAWQVGDAHKANRPSCSPAIRLIASAAITLNASSTRGGEPSRHRRSPWDVKYAAARPPALQSLMAATADSGSLPPSAAAVAAW